MTLPVVVGKPSPRVSIIVPAYNAARFLEAAVTGIQKQTVSDWELVIADDGSSDATVELAQRLAAADPRIRVVVQANAGPSAARNRGYAETSTESPYVIFLDADDVWEADTLSHLITVLERSPEALAAYGTARYMDADGNEIHDEFIEFHQSQRWGVVGNRIVAWPSDSPTTFAVESLMERIITAGTVLIRRATLDTVGVWDPSLRMWEDWDLWLRICLAGNIAFTDRVVLRYRRHSSNLSNDQTALEDGEKRIRRRLIAALKTDAANRETAIAGFRLFRRCMSLQFSHLARRAALRGNVIGAIKWARRATMEFWEYLRQSDWVEEAPVAKIRPKMSLDMPGGSEDRW